ncbi:metallophosphoesterase family protein [Paenibacillus tepidiphilus]|uniref:metallophosphoesterase family protein n=1 Tax=Paenibacillus tepidiphilus TaxID=2608683 RepID=UPI00123A66FE|nr:metallophosphoesterase [Paenibacillus tepidiphilus]
MKPIYFAHLTDTHINAPEKQHPMFGVDMTAKLRAVMGDIRTLRTKPAFILISGDLTQDGDLADYRHLKAVIEEEAGLTGIPVHVILGNHDFRAPFREGYLGEAPSDKPYYYSFIENGLRIVMLNSQIPGSHGGELDEQQLEWLDEILAQPAEQGNLLVIHHPVTLTSSELMDGHLLRNPQSLAKVIKGRKVIGLLAGHIHFHNIGSFHGVPSCAAAGVAFGLDPASADAMRFLDNSGYNLVTVKDGVMAVQPRMLPGSERLMYELTAAAMAAHQ